MLRLALLSGVCGGGDVVGALPRGLITGILIDDGCCSSCRMIRLRIFGFSFGMSGSAAFE